jgi:zinc protease
MFARPLAFAALIVVSLLRPAHAEPVTHIQLENGLEVVVIEDRRAPVVVHMVWYRVGAADEPPLQSGIAHFLEHLLFKGTDHACAPGAFSEVVEANGGRDNAFTSWDYTGYFQRVASDRLALMMEMEADRMQNLAFTDAEWMPERGVILEERGQVLESRVGAQFNEAMLAALFKAHPYGIPIIGWRHEMEGLTGDMAMDFYRQHYGPNNAILVIAGDVDTAASAGTGARPLRPDPAKSRYRAHSPPRRTPASGRTPPCV